MSCTVHDFRLERFLRASPVLILANVVSTIHLVPAEQLVVILAQPVPTCYYNISAIITRVRDQNVCIHIP